MARILIKDLNTKKDETVSVNGWIDVRRDQGKLIFLDIRDRTGIVQSVVLPQNILSIEVAKQLRPEWVVEILGKVNERPEKNKNLDVINGDIELEVLEIKILNEAE
ncbi:MAG: OB-fold nucleic acid binding domain-containing protein, partial [bacterium]|nr:OB-fold nucleic acid binding domain-containing protein [bacterium]